MEQLANNPVTTLSSGINSSATSLTVASASAFPTAGDFTIKIGTELLKVTGVSGTTFTVTRGQESTTAASHSASDPVTLVVTTNSLIRLMAEMFQSGGYASRPSAVRAGTTYYADDYNAAWNYNGTNWNLVHPVYIPYANRVNTSGWTALNIGSDTWTNVNGIAVVNKVASVGLRGYYKSLPTAPFNAYCCIGPTLQTHAEVQEGIVLYDSGTGKCKYVARGTATNTHRFNVQNWTTTSTFSANLLDNAKLMASRQASFLRFEDDNTNWNYYISHDGVFWAKVFSETRNTFLTPTNIGLATYRDTTIGSSFTWHTHFLAYWEA